MRGQLSEYYFFLEKKNAFEVIIWLFRSLALPLSENQNSQCYLCPLLGGCCTGIHPLGIAQRDDCKILSGIAYGKKKKIPQE